MTTVDAPALAPDFVMTQKERDAIEIIRHFPYREDSDALTLSGKIGIFMARLDDRDMPAFASNEVDGMILEALDSADSGKLEEKYAESRDIIESMFERAGFRCEKIGE